MRILLVLAVWASFLGCAHRAARPRPQPQVIHVVLCWLNDPGNEIDRQRLIDASYALKQIPGVVSVAAGPAIASPRPVVDSSFDIAVVMTFTDEAALRAYDQHPLHQRAVADVLRPLTQRLLIYHVRRAEPAAHEKADAAAAPASGASIERLENRPAPASVTTP